MLKIYLRLAANANNGVGYYRQWLPLKTAERKGKIKLKCDYFDFGTQSRQNPDEKDLKKKLEWADIVYFNRNDVAWFYNNMLYAKKMIGKKIVLDNDDNIYAVRPWNPGYQSYHPNSMAQKLHKEFIPFLDGLTVSTKNLKELYKDSIKNIVVLPNSLDLKSFGKVVRKPNERLIIGWTGSSAHWENLKLIEDVIIEILKEFPNVEFQYVGGYVNLFENISKDIASRIKAIPFHDLKGWHKYLNSLNFDIALAPLADNMFNRAKSNLRWIEYSACSYPTIASNVEAYKCIRNGIDGILCSSKQDWYKAIKGLINNPDKRKELAKMANIRIKNDFNIDKNYKLWLDFLTKIKKDNNKKL